MALRVTPYILKLETEHFLHLLTTGEKEISLLWLCLHTQFYIFSLFTDCFFFFYFQPPSWGKQLGIHQDVSHRLEMNVSYTRLFSFPASPSVLCICLFSCSYSAVCQPVQERKSLCEGNKTEDKEILERGERKRSKTVAEQDPVSKMRLEGSPSSLHPAFPWSSTLRRINSIHVKL